MDPSKYRQISLLKIGGKVLEKFIINRINHHMYKNNLMTDRQFGFTPQKSIKDAVMEAKIYRIRTGEYMCGHNDQPGCKRSY